MEIWDLYTAGGEKTGRTICRGEKLPQGTYLWSAKCWFGTPTVAFF